MPLVQVTGELIPSKDIEWKIFNFFSLSETNGSYYDSPSFTFGNGTWHLRIYPGGHKDAKYGFLSCGLENETRYPCYLAVTCGIKKGDGTLIGRVLTDANISAHRWACCVNFYKKSALKQREDELVPSGILTIYFSLKLNQDGKQDTKEINNLPVSDDGQEILEVFDHRKLTDLDVLSENLRRLFTNEDSCDIVLQVQGKEFKAHKIILMARSSVFAAMLKPNTLESQRGIVDITDCDDQSFPQFLEYLYCGQLDEISFQSAFHLYSTSNKYDIENLKKYCVTNLIENLTANNVCEVIILADKYDDEKLLSAAQDFFTENCSKIFATTNWKSLMRGNCHLANQFLIEMSKIKGLN